MIVQVIGQMSHSEVDSYFHTLAVNNPRVVERINSTDLTLNFVGLQLALNNNLSKIRCIKMSKKWWENAEKLEVRLF